MYFLLSKTTKPMDSNIVLNIFRDSEVICTVNKLYIIFTFYM